MNRTQKHYIAYMDILGYKDYLKSAPDKSQEYLNTILDAIKKVKQSVSIFENRTMPMFRIDGGLRYKVFSDNILLCMPVGEGKDEIRRAIVFLIIVASIQRGLVLQHGLIVRGGITSGDLFINDDIVYGQGLIDAVTLEKTAEYPCVIVSDSLQKELSALRRDVGSEYQKVKEIVQRINKTGEATKEEDQYLSNNLEQVAREVYYSRSLQELLRYYENEKAFVNYLFDLSFNTLLGYEFAAFVNKVAAENPGNYKGLVETYEDYYGILLAHKEMVMKKVNAYCHYNDVDKTDKAAVTAREKIIHKYIWLLRYHNTMCTERKFPQGILLHKFGCDQNVLRLIVKTGS